MLEPLASLCIAAAHLVDEDNALSLKTITDPEPKLSSTILVRVALEYRGSHVHVSHFVVGVVGAKHVHSNDLHRECQPRILLYWLTA